MKIHARHYLLDGVADHAAMSKGERPQALGQSLQKSFATRWAPVGGTFVLGISLMPPLPKTCPKMVSAPQKGVAFLTETVFEKNSSPSARRSRRTPRIQNISGLPQRPATASVVG